MNPKIIERTKIKELAEELKAQGKKIVTTNGSFDILHIGHIRMLEDAKKQGDILIVGLNSDSSIKEYKSPFRPINSQELRAEFIASINCVDYVFVFDELNPIKFLEEIQPHVHCNDISYGENCIEASTVKTYGGKIYLIPQLGDFSTTKMIQRLHDASLKEKEEKKIEIINLLEKQKGVLFADSAIVHREVYSGRDIISKNSKFEKGYTDERGYVPVEWWIMSKTSAENPIQKSGEGITKLIINNKKILFTDAIKYAGDILLGKCKKNWPLTKILDIGGEIIKTSFSTNEVPPIPLHVHPGYIKDGKICSQGKLEAYFFPPVDVSPYNKNFGEVITRLGLTPETTKESFKEGLKQFGKSDFIYSLCNIYNIKAYDGWTIPPKTIHAPGPWTTFEIQKPQDDYNLAGWQLGKRLSDVELNEKKDAFLFRGFKDENDLMDQAIDWQISTDKDFKKKYYYHSKLLDFGKWGRKFQIFSGEFYGEAFEINPGMKFKRCKDEKAFAGIVWSGQGKLNGNKINVSEKIQKEFLVVPETEIEIENTGNEKLIIYTIFPMKNKIKNILVTGGAGFIGSNLAIELESQGHNIVIVDNLFSGTKDNLKDFNGKFIQADISEPLEFKEKFDVIFHIAAITDPRHDNDEETYSKNVEGFKQMIKLAQEHNAKLIYASTANLYGNGPAPMKENQEKKIISVYGQSKLTMDKIASQYFDKMHIVGLRYFNVFGPRESHKGRPASMIYHLYNQMKEGKNPRLFKFGEQSRDHIYVKDVVDATIKALEAPSGIYNVGTGKAIDFNEIVEHLNGALGTQLEAEYFDMNYDPKTYQVITQADTTLAERELGFKAKYSIKEGIKDYVNWLEENK